MSTHDTLNLTLARIRNPAHEALHELEGIPSALGASEYIKSRALEICELAELQRPAEDLYAAAVDLAAWALALVVRLEQPCTDAPTRVRTPARMEIKVTCASCLTLFLFRCDPSMPPAEDWCCSANCRLAHEDAVKAEREQRAGDAR